MTITIDLEDELYERLCQLAADQRITPEELARRAVVEWIDRQQAFDKAMRATFDENHELYRRLAESEAAERRQSLAQGVRPGFPRPQQ